MSNVDNIQHGGDHYKEGGAMQHWNMLLLVGFGWEYYIGAASKYAARYAKKRGAEDVQKAIHFVDKLLDAIERAQVPAAFRTTQGFRMNLDAHPAVYNLTVNIEQLCQQFFEANGITSEYAQAAIQRLFEARVADDLRDARASLVALHDEVTGHVEPAPVEPTAAERVAQKTAGAASALGVAPIKAAAAKRRKSAKPE